MKRLLLVAMLWPAPASAQLIGFCSTVGATGPSSCASETTGWIHYVEAINQGIKQVQSYAQDTLHLQETIKVFTLANQMSLYLSGHSMWPSSHYAWIPVFVSDTFGRNTGWQNVNNIGGDPNSALNKIVQPLSVGMIPGVPGPFQGPLRNIVSAIERHDGMLTGSMGTVGGYSMASAPLAAKLASLAQSVISSLASDQTYAAQMQKMSSATMLNTQTNAAGVELIKQQVLNQQVQMIMQREAAANEMNAQLYTYTNATGNLTMTQNTSGALHALRVP